jgi:hypothetical protein
MGIAAFVTFLIPTWMPQIKKKPVFVRIQFNMEFLD